MKKLLITCAVTLLLCGGCSGLFKTTVAVTEIRDSIMTELGVHYRAGLISPDVDKQIEEADKQYREAAKTAAEALKLYKATGEGDPVQAIQLTKAFVLKLLDILRTYQNVDTMEKQLFTTTKL